MNNPQFALSRNKKKIQKPSNGSSQEIVLL